MAFTVFKVIVTALLVVGISEIAKRDDRLGGLVAAMPVMTLLVIGWMYAEGATSQKISNHMTYTLVYLVPTIPMFLVFPFLIQRLGFMPTVLMCLTLTAVLVGVTDALTRQYGYKLL
ncbi:MAG: DUF3147 family protein [Parvibaculales bacterium]